MNEIIRAVGAEDFVKISIISAKGMVEYARSVHGLTPVTTAALGRTLCAASLMGDLMKEVEGSLTIRINGGGPIGSVIAVSDSSGNCRGYVTNPSLDLPTRETDGKLDVGGAVGRDGMLTLSRDLGMREPYIGSTELLSGEIADDLARYLTESEQIPSACALGVLIDTDYSVKAAGGFIVSLMPGASEELITQLEDNIFMMDALSTILAEDGIDEVLNQVMKGMNPRTLSRSEVEYRCTCSEDKVRSAVGLLGAEELSDMASRGEPVEADCQFCNRHYAFDPKEILRDMADV